MSDVKIVNFGAKSQMKQRRVPAIHNRLTTRKLRRKFREDRRAPPTLSALSVAGWGLPDRLLCRLRFTDVLSNTTAAGAYSEIFYRCIGPYDPRVAAGGDYPSYYSQLLALYQYQQVTFSKMDVYFLPEGTDLSGSQAEAVVYPSTTAAGVTTINDAIDKRNSRYTSISIYQPKGTSHISHKVVPWKMLGMSKQQYRDDDTTRSLTGAVPARILYWAIGIQNNTTATNAIQVRIRITYTIEFQSLVPVDTLDSAND